jgi:hypothetical protein
LVVVIVERIGSLRRVLCGQGGGGPLDDGVDDLVKDRAFVLEVAIERGVSDAHALGDVRHTGIVVTRFCEHLDGRVDDLLAQSQLAPFGVGGSSHD